MTEKAPHFDHDADSGVISAQLPLSPEDSPKDGSPIQREDSPPIQRQNSHHSILSFNQLSEGVVVYNEVQVASSSGSGDQVNVQAERSSGEDTERADSEEIAGPPLPESSNGEAHFTIGPSLESCDCAEQSTSAVLLQVYQETKEKLGGAEEKLKKTEDKLLETKEQLAVAEAKNCEVQHQLVEMTKKKDEAERKLADVQAKRAKELQRYKEELAKYKERLADVEKKNETQRVEYEEKIKVLKEKMEEMEKKYDKDVLKLTQQNCDLKVLVSKMEVEEHSLKRRIAELKCDLERQEKESLAEQLAACRSNSADVIAEKNARINTLERLLSEVSVNSNSSQDN